MKKLSIQLNQDYKSFEKGFNVTLEGELIILSGVNGGGKSQLMDIISQKESHHDKKNIVATINLDDKKINFHDVLRRSFKDNITVPEFTPASAENVNRHKAQAYSAYQNNRLDYNSFPLLDYKGSCELAKKVLIEKLGEQRFSNSSLSQQEITDTLPSYFIWKRDDIFTNFVGELFFNYALEEYHAKAQAGEIGDKFTRTPLLTPPWEQLNKLFSDLGFEYRFKDNYFIDKGFRLNEQPNLYQIKIDGTINENEQRKLADLSDGEKAIISLSFASLSGVKYEDRKILLLDEFDANFNPSLTEIFYKILSEYFTSKGILVVIAAHSPTTISFAPENASFYEVFKKNTGLLRMLPVQKEEYTELKIANKGFYTKIADQNARINELQSEVEKLQKIKDEILRGTKPIIITEGKTDIQHIKKAKEKLNISDCDVEFCKIPENFGWTELKKLLDSIAVIPNTRKIVGIFDRDVTKIVSDIEKDGCLIKPYGNNVYAFCLPVPSERKNCTNISIELYYKDVELKKEKDGKCLYFYNEVSQWTEERTKEKKTIKLPHPIIDKENEGKIFDKDIGSEYWIHSKSRFADLVENDDEFSGNFNFDNFHLIFNVIKEIVK